MTYFHPLYATNILKVDNNSEVLWRRARASRNFAVMEEKKGNMDGKKQHLDNGMWNKLLKY